MSITRKFSQLYPLHTFQEGVKRNLFFSLFLVLFLLIFRPFGLEVYPYEESYLIVGYGIVTFLTILFCDFISTHYLKEVFNEERWTVVRQLIYSLIVLILLGITNYLYAFWIDAFPGTITGFLKVQLYVLLSCMVPVAMVVLWRQNQLLRKHLSEAGSLTSELPGRGFPKPVAARLEDPEMVVLVGENRNETLQVHLMDLICVSSKENYIEVVWQDGNKITKSLLRSALIKAEEKFAGSNYIFRSHRCYLVNLFKVVAVEGNAQGYRLSVEGLEETIPVARGRGADLHEALALIRNG